MEPLYICYFIWGSFFFFFFLFLLTHVFKIHPHFACISTLFFFLLSCLVLIVQFWEFFTYNLDTKSLSYVWFTNIFVQSLSSHPFNKIFCCVKVLNFAEAYQIGQGGISFWWDMLLVWHLRTHCLEWNLNIFLVFFVKVL